MLTIWGRLNSHNVKKIVWLAEELGLPWVRHDVGGKFGMDDAYLAKNPNALIPTIEDGDLVLWESNAILRYLAAKYGVTLYPFFLDGVALDPSFTQPDGLHPTARGVAEVVKRIMPDVEALVQRISQRKTAAN